MTYTSSSDNAHSSSAGEGGGYSSSSEPAVDAHTMATLQPALLQQHQQDFFRAPPAPVRTAAVRTASIGPYYRSHYIARSMQHMLCTLAFRLMRQRAHLTIRHSDARHSPYR